MENSIELSRFDNCGSFRVSVDDISIIQQAGPSTLIITNKQTSLLVKESVAQVELKVMEAKRSWTQLRDGIIRKR